MRFGLSTYRNTWPSGTGGLELFCAQAEAKVMNSTPTSFILPFWRGLVDQGLRVVDIDRAVQQVPPRPLSSIAPVAINC